MEDDVTSILDGTIGWFWPWYEKPRRISAEPERGYIRLIAPDTVELTALDEDAFRDDGGEHIPRPRLITGATERGGLLMLDVKGVGLKTRMGGSAASVRHYRARTLLANAPIEDIRSERLRSLSAHFFGISRWFGLTGARESVSRDQEGRLTGFTVRVESQPEASIRIPGGREVAISPYWSTRGSADRRTINAPVELECRSARPQSLWALRQPLLRIQDLISFCYEGSITAEGGLATPDLTKEAPEELRLWDAWLMVTRPGVVQAARKDFPLLTLQELGGMPSLRRWLILCSNHLRAVRPVIEPYRYGKASPPVRILEIAAAMEYWVATHRRTTAWAKESCCRRRGQGCGWAWPIARSVGGSFDQWVGDSREWSHRFWGTYNKLKHEPEYVFDEYELATLAESASLLLAVALLCRVSRNKEPARRLFADTSATWPLQRRVQNLFKDSN
ncbi:hypothetical protein AB0B85_12455 [Micromonospora sp. NPDC049044]|uniref:ApeA N-terminal domain 1-containing protein n=1 Tax=Micromonospora sp. NPDC049044 TaxID=3154827 RepID=UPI00340FF7C1